MMLSFQNFHQFVYNMSQVASAVSSTYIRPTSTTVKKKPEVDVYCSESFMNALKQSESEKIFNGTENVKFGPGFEDIQWIYSKDIDFRFIAEKPVTESDFYLSLEKNYLKVLCMSSILEKLHSNQQSGIKQKQILEDLKTDLMKKSKWSESFISKKSFDENKQSSFCGNHNKKISYNVPLSIRLVGTVNSYLKSPEIFSVQKRGFKSKRALNMEKEANVGIISKLRKNLNDQLDGLQGNVQVKNLDKKILDCSAVSEMIKSDAVTSEEKQKIKISFAEGYLTAVKSVGKPVLPRFLKYTVYGLIIVALGFFLLNSARGKVFQMRFNNFREIDQEKIDVTFSDVKGVQEVKEELMEIVEFLRNPARFSSLGGKLPKGVLLVGPPGTGKTLLARAVAGEANVPFFHASGSEFEEIFVGEGARKVRNLFLAAKAKAPCIIFIDEIDCVGAKRMTSMLHPYANQTLNQLLSEMDGFAKNEGVIVIGATNRKSDLDSALLRPGRFDVEVVVPLPDFEGRKEILQLYMSKILCEKIDITKMAKATVGCSGADLEAIVNHAAIRAATDGVPYVTMEYLESAKDKILLGPERKLTLKNEDAIMTAYHEGGHAIVAHFTEEADAVDKVTIVPRGKALGHTSCLPESDTHQITKAKCLAKMDVLLGGRAAEELVFGLNKVTANASDDLEKATMLATSMVKNFGMSEKVGVRTLKSSEEKMVTVNEFGQAVTDQVDVEVKRLIQESYERTKKILKEHAKEHKLLAEALVKCKTLSPEDVKAILGDNSIGRPPLFQHDA